MRPTSSPEHRVRANGETGAGSWIAALLRFDRNGDTFVARRPAAPGDRLFGGLVAAQALAAACATVDDEKLPQSLHAYFVRGGEPGVDIELVVERTRDGRSFDTRRVTASQGELVIFEMLASFHRPESGADLHPPAPSRCELDDTAPVLVPGELQQRFEIRAPGTKTAMFSGPPYWIRSVEPVEDDPISQACALAYMSDIALMAAARPPGTPLMAGIAMAASLDHSIWFHRPFRPDRWHRYEAGSLNNNDARGLALGAFYDADDTLVATMAQEALWRV
jgi:acyl-CoA thioesterase-2